MEAEERLRETPPLVKTPSGYVQQSPWLDIANKQLELMGRYMVELGLTPAARSRVMAGSPITGGASPRSRSIDPRDRRRRRTGPSFTLRTLAASTAATDETRAAQ